MRLLSGLFFFFFSMVLFLSCDDDASIAPLRAVRIEGNEYPIIKIGNRTWTAVNYAGAGGVYYDEANSKPEYGKYYTRAELNAINLPAGWRIPTMDDYKALAQVYDITIPSLISNSEPIKTLISKTQWSHVQGTNVSGFNAYPTGYIFRNSTPLDGDMAEFWTAEGNSLSIQEAGANLSSLRIALYESNSSPDYRFTVRFVKD